MHSCKGIGNRRNDLLELVVVNLHKQKRGREEKLIPSRIMRKDIYEAERG
jgi:hypothetical protein